jgi:hypothetical protein
MPQRRIEDEDVQLHAFLISALDGGERSASRPGCFNPGIRAPGIHWRAGWVGPRARLDPVDLFKYTWNRKMFRIKVSDLNEIHTLRHVPIFYMASPFWEKRVFPWAPVGPDKWWRREIPTYLPEIEPRIVQLYREKSLAWPRSHSGHLYYRGKTSWTPWISQWWALELIWMWWWRRIFKHLRRDSNPGHPVAMTGQLISDKWKKKLYCEHWPGGGWVCLHANSKTRFQATTGCIKVKAPLQGLLRLS